MKSSLTCVFVQEVVNDSQPKMDPIDENAVTPSLNDSGKGICWITYIPLRISNWSPWDFCIIISWMKSSSACVLVTEVFDNSEGKTAHLHQNTAAVEGERTKVHSWLCHLNFLSCTWIHSSIINMVSFETAGSKTSKSKSTSMSRSYYFFLHLTQLSLTFTSINSSIINMVSFETAGSKTSKSKSTSMSRSYYFFLHLTQSSLTFTSINWST